MRFAIGLSLVVMVGLAAGCASGPPRPDLAYRAASKVRAPVLVPPGLVYQKTKAPLSFHPTDFGAKYGRATSSQIGLPPLPFPGLSGGLDLFGWGDASLETAASNGGMTEIKHTDYQFEVILMIYRRFTVEAHGD